MIAEVATAALLRVTIAPARVRIGPREHTRLTVRAPGSRAARVVLSVGAYSLDLRGRPVVGNVSAPWVRVVPRALTVPAHGAATVDVTAAVPAPASAGDHAFVVLASVRDAGARASPILVRLGVVAVVRVPGAVRHRLLAGAPSVTAARRLRVVVANRGNVEEWLARAAMTLTLRRGSRVVAVLRSRARRVLAQAKALFEWPVPVTLHGTVVAHSTFGRGRAYRLRL